MTKQKTAEIGMCRGKWSRCKGANSSKSVKWHLCQECTVKRAKAMYNKEPKAAPVKLAAPAKADPHAKAQAKVSCPRCKAEAGKPCIWKATHSKGKVHADRIRLKEATTTKK